MATEVFRKSEYGYTVWFGNVCYELSGEWNVEAVTRFIKEYETEE